MRRGARPGDWKVTPMPAEHAVVPCGRVFDEIEMLRVRQGVVPEEMEDKWFVVCDGDVLDVHRSWTGHHLFRAELEKAPFGERVARLTVNRHPAQFRTDEAVAAAQLAWVCDVLLLDHRYRVWPDTLRIPSISIVPGDITEEQCDAIVNAANEALAGGGGVDGAIHAAAGSKLDEACMVWPIVLPPDGTRPIRGVRCPTGEARVTPAYGKLRCRWIIHAVGPVHGVPDDAALLRDAFDAALDAAVEHGARRVAVPAISCGVFRFPLAQAARIALESARTPRDLDEIRFVLFDNAALAAWRAAAQLPER